MLLRDFVASGAGARGRARLLAAALGVFAGGCEGRAVGGNDTDGASGCNGGEGCAEGEVCSDGACVAACIGQAGARCGDAGLPPCAEGLTCISSSNGARFCMAPPTEEGAACLSGRCGDGLVCDRFTMPGRQVCTMAPATGDPCLVGVLCGTDDYCDQADPDGPVCASLPGLGDACPQGACMAGLFCDFTGAEADRVCREIPDEVGDPCPASQCAAGLVCDYDETRGEALCQALPTMPGERCDGGRCFGEGIACDQMRDPPICRTVPDDPGEPCLNGNCGEALLCDFSASEAPVCRLVPDEAGEPCVQNQCGEGLTCRQDAATPTCDALPGAGEPCEGGRCDANSYCDWSDGATGRCRRAPAEGEACDGQTGCRGDGWCDVWTDPMAPVCMPIGQVGDPCRGHRFCESNHCPSGFCEPLPDRIGAACPSGFCGGDLVCRNQVCVREDFCAE